MEGGGSCSTSAAATILTLSRVPDGIGAETTHSAVLSVLWLAGLLPSNR